MSFWNYLIEKDLLKNYRRFPNDRLSLFFKIYLLFYLFLQESIV